MKSKTKHTNKMNIKKKIEQIDAKSNKIKTAPEKKAPELVSQLKALKGEFDITRILGRYAPLILAPAEGSSIEPRPLDLIGWGLTNDKNVQTKS